MRSYDVVVVTDPRLVGGGNKSIAQEVRAHATVGYTTGVLPYASNTNGARPVDFSIRKLIDDGLAEWVPPDAGARCRLAMARGPSLFLEHQPGPVRLKAERAVLVANAVHPDPSLSAMAYDPAAVDARLTKVFGRRWDWVSLSEVVRRELTALADDLQISAETWANIVRLDHWRLPRTEKLDHPVRVGRHSRDTPAKWPDTKAEILAAYPAAPDFDVRIMGGARAPIGLLGRLPQNWRVEEFGARHPRSFLGDVDVFPYCHHPRWVEAFGRAPLEAIATGAVPILPQYLEAVFGPGALYGTPADVRPLVQRLADDPGFLAEQRERGWAVVRDRFSPEAYLARLDTLIGPPSAPTVAVTTRAASLPATKAPSGGRSRSRSDADRPGRPRVLFFTDNGHGLGHIFRMLAVATRCTDRVSPFLLTMSQAVEVAAAAGVPVEYFPSAKRLGIDRAAWRELFRIRLEQLAQRLRPELLVVDHVNPPPQIFDVAADHRVQTMWVRRGLWRAGRSPEGGRYTSRFDHILEPLDLAAALDRGATTRMAHPSTHYVRPVNLVDATKMAARDDARQLLGLPPDGPAVLINMSADTTAALVRLLTKVRDEVRRRVPDAALFAPTHIMHADELPVVDGVVMKPIYPVARYLHAFDAAVSTTGYNAFHEIVLSGTPAIFVARDTGTLDDQALRARTAGLGGFGRHVEDFWSAEFGSALDEVLDPVRARRMRAAAVVAHPGNGAGDAARLVTTIALGGKVRAP